MNKLFITNSISVLLGLGNAYYSNFWFNKKETLIVLIFDIFHKLRSENNAST